MKTVVHMVNGILNKPGDAKNWNVEGVDWIHTNSDYYGVAIQYFAGPIDRVFGQTDRSQKLRDSLLCYQGQPWRHVLVGHSNGCDVICDCIQSFSAKLPAIDQLHLVCGATEDDFNVNGMNTALLQEKVGTVNVYRAGNDQALKLANTWFGRVLGYGSSGPLGYKGPQNVDPILASRVKLVDWPNWGHSECWTKQNYDATMRLFLA